MYGTVARMRAKPGTGTQLRAVMDDFKAAQIPGWITTYVYRMDADANEYYIAVIFQDKAAYQANAQSPEQDQRYHQLMSVLEEAPEWHDGEIVAS